MSSTPEPASPRLGFGLIVAGTLAFVVIVAWLPPSRGRTLAALAIPILTLLALAIWWLRRTWVGRRAKITGVSLALLAGLFLAFVPTFPASLIAVLWGLPLALGAAFVVHTATRRSRPSARALAVAAALLVTLSPWAFLRADGASGQMMPNLVWTWRASAREQARVAETTADGRVLESLQVTPSDWPGFRGVGGDGVVSDEVVAQLDLDWTTRAPAECWRRLLGPGWSSFAVVGGLACTQDQDGELERVLCLEADSGRTVWVHSDRARFDEVAGGPGPRATPLIHDGRLYALGASGRLNCLDATTGRPIWSIDLSVGSEQTPVWGFASSPVIRGDLLYVAPAGIGGVRLLALDRLTGEPIWQAAGESSGYASARIATLAGTVQVLLFDGGGLAGWDAATGEMLWEHGWPTGQPMAAQPQVLGDDAVAIGMGYGRGTKRLSIRRQGTNWRVVEEWSTHRLKPKFNSFVLHRGHLFGLDEGILTCLDAATGERVWKGGRYGYGQLLLVGDTLLIVTESGDLVLAEASPAGHNELARVRGLSGKSWSHPAIGDGRLFVRNASEAACFDLRRAGATGSR